MLDSIKWLRNMRTRVIGKRTSSLRPFRLVLTATLTAFTYVATSSAADSSAEKCKYPDDLEPSNECNLCLADKSPLNFDPMPPSLQRTTDQATTGNTTMAFERADYVLFLDKNRIPIELPPEALLPDALPKLACEDKGRYDAFKEDKISSSYTMYKIDLDSGLPYELRHCAHRPPSAGKYRSLCSIVDIENALENGDTAESTKIVLRALLARATADPRCRLLLGSTLYAMSKCR